MKAEFFVVGFCLLFAGAYFTYVKHQHRGNSEANIVISSDNSYEEINYSGKINFSEDETSIRSISPGGYLKFRKNDENLLAESNMKGEISYELREGNNKILLDSNGKKFITVAIKEMIAWGIDAGERMERIYKKGGNAALLREVDNLKSDQVKRMYFERVLQSDSLSAGDRAGLAKKISISMGSDGDKEQLLRKFTVDQLADSVTAHAYLQAVESFGDENSKADALKNIMLLPMSKELFPQVMHVINGLGDGNQRARMIKIIIEKGKFEKDQLDQVLAAIGNSPSDMDKENLFAQLIIEKAIPADCFGKLLELIEHFGSGMQKENLYKKLMDNDTLTEDQWTGLINEAAKLDGDFEKSNMLLQISLKMPKSENIKTAYLKAAKTIAGDMEFGKAVRAVE